jgi:hypothetical protein
MDLRQLASTEASALAERLSTAMTAEIQAAAERTQATADAALAKIRAEADQLKASLARTATDQKTLQAALDKLRAEAKSAQALIEKLRADERASQASIEKLHADERASQAAIEKLRADERVSQASIDKLRADQQALQAALEKSRKEDASLRTALEQARASEAAVKTALEKARAQEQALRAALAKEQERAKAAQVALGQAQAAQALAEAERSKAIVAAEQAAARAAAPAVDQKLATDLEEMRGLLASVTAERDDIAAEMARAEALWVEQSRALRDQVQKIASGRLDQLREAFQRLASASSVADVMTILIEALGGDFSRVALFQVNGNRLEGRQQSGFDAVSDISKVVVPLTKGSALADAVRSGRVQGLTADELTDTSRKLFGGSPSFVLILPVTIGGSVQAVLYADNSDQPQPHIVTPRRGVHFAEILLWHAVPLIARLSAEEKALSDLREYGAQLLGDLENVYASDVTAGHKGEKLQRRLQHNVEYARSMYAQRAQASGPLAAGVFDDQIVHLIAQKRSTAFGRDLSAAAGIADDQKLSAEAS